MGYAASAALALLFVSAAARPQDAREHGFLIASERVSASDKPGTRRELLAAVGAGGYGSVCDGARRGRGRVQKCTELEGCAWRPGAKACVPESCSAYPARPGCELSPSCNWISWGEGITAHEGCYACGEIKNDEICQAHEGCAWVQKGWYEGCHDCSDLTTEEVCNYLNTGGTCYWADAECKNFKLI